MDNTLTDCFAVILKTSDGPLAAGGICMKGCRDYWIDRMSALSRLQAKSHDIYEIDACLAAEIAKLSDSTLLIAGATWKLDIQLPYEVRTGGVLGSPASDIVSADGAAESLPEGFSMRALPGGPGLAARAPEEVTWRVLQAVIDMGAHDDTAIMEIMKEAGIREGMLIFDGTGYRAQGYILVFSEEDRKSAKL